MRDIKPRFPVFIMGIALLLMGCSPTAPGTFSQVASTPGADVAGARATPLPTNVSAFPTPMEVGGTSTTVTPSAAEARAIQQRLRDMDRDMLRLHQDLPRLTPQQRQQQAQLLADVMSEAGQVMTLMQQAMDQMTPEERQAADSAMQRMAADMQHMQQLLSAVTPGPAGPGVAPGMGPGPGPGMGPGMMWGTPGTGPVGPGGAPAMGQMGQQMGQMSQQMRAHVGQMDLQQMQAVMGDMADMAASMEQLMGQVEPALNRMTPEQRQALAQQVERMQATVQQMMQVAGPGAATPSPAPTGTPGAL